MENFGYPLEAVIVLIALFLCSFYIDVIGHKSTKPMSFLTSVLWSIGWISVGCLFGVFLWIEYGGHVAMLYFTGYLLEKSLSIDHILVFTAIFSSFRIQREYLQHKILMWGIIGAIVLRALFVALGAEIFALHFSVQIIFAGIIFASAYAMLTRKTEEDIEDYSKHTIIRFVSYIMPVTKKQEGNAFFIKKTKWYATPAFICLCVIELSDVLFAVDSVPAIFAITHEPLLVYSAILFAIMGLRALYFVVQHLISYLHYLEKSIIFLLCFIGIKMLLLAFNIHIPNVISLSVIGITIMLGVALSFIIPKNKEKNTI